MLAERPLATKVTALAALKCLRLAAVGLDPAQGTIVSLDPAQGKIK